MIKVLQTEFDAQNCKQYFMTELIIENMELRDKNKVLSENIEYLKATQATAKVLVS